MQALPRGAEKLSMQEIKKIVVIGPESTGKSTLCQQLAQHYNAVWCPEYAREYLLKNGTNYTFEDLLTIAKRQLALEDEYTLKASMEGKLLFLDTDMFVMKVWCEYVFGRCHQFILDNIVNRQYNLYLLCNIDLPWVKDELREYPDLQSRKELYHIYKDIMINQAVTWVNISGYYNERLGSAIKAVDRLLT